MIRICPSILNANFDDLPNEILKVAGHADFLHLDVMDNVFVPNFTFDLEKSLEIIDVSALPVDVHLMISNPDTEAVKYAAANTASITVHFEACKDPLQTLREIKSRGVRAGLAVKPDTPIELVEELLPDLDMILVMTVEPGFGGQKFMSEMMPKVEKARNWLREKSFNEKWIQVDGGISLDTISTAYQAGADTFVAGSAVYRSDNPAEMIDQLRQKALS
jgi:ribulose-phosphate 3-epimerase